MGPKKKRGRLQDKVPRRENESRNDETRESVSAPTRNISTPSKKILAPTRNTSAATRKISAPTEDISAPTEKISATTGDISAPTKTSAPTRKISAPTEDISASTEKISAPSRKISAPTEDISAPTEKISAPTRKISAPTRKISAPTEDISVHTEKISASTRKISAPTEKTSAPTEKTSAPTEKTLAPTEKTSAPTEKTSASTEKTSAPTEDISTPTEDISAPTEKISAATRKISATTGGISAPTEKTSAPTGDISAPTRKVSAATGDASAPTGKILAPTGDISPANENFSPPTKKLTLPTTEEGTAPTNNQRVSPPSKHHTLSTTEESNFSPPTKNLTLPTTKQGAAPITGQRVSPPITKLVLPTTENDTAPIINQRVSLPTKKLTIPPTEESTAPIIDQRISPPTKQHTLSTTKESTLPPPPRKPTLPTAEEDIAPIIDQRVSPPPKKLTLPATEEDTAPITYQRISPPTTKLTLPITEKSTFPIVDQRIFPPTKKHALSTTEEPSSSITKGHNFLITGKHTLSTTEEPTSLITRGHTLPTTGKHTLSTTEEPIYPITRGHTFPTTEEHILPRSQTQIHEGGDIPEPGKPGGSNCFCWFRTLGENPTEEAHLPPPPLRQETDVVPLELAKSNVSDLYKPLKKWQTRIITILPASNEPLQCKLWTADLIAGQGVAVSGTSDIVTYDALSYSWGSGSPTGRVICNGVNVLVNDTLASALRVLRDQQKRRHIWCDVLCINQSDPVEKAQQVRNMLRIFEKAERVIAWIGLPDRWTRPLFHVLSDKEDSSKDPSCSPHAAISYGLARGGWRHDPECLKNVSEIVRAAGEHLRRPWFRRTWVRQEVFGTSNLTIYCGGETTSLSNLITAIRRILDFEQRLLSNPLQVDIPPPLDQHPRNVPKRLSSLVPESVFVLQESYEHASTDRHDYKQPRQRLRYSAHWLRVLNGGADFEVTDPRDKVYGVLGIITSRTTRWYVEIPPDIQKIEFPISYTKSVSEVYEDVVKHLVNVDRNFDALQVFEDRCQRAKDLPSWVTDWRQNIRRSIVRCAPDNKDERDRIGQAPIQDRNDVGKLILEGVQVGGPLNGINISKRRWKAPTFPEPERMDSNYEEMISSDCFVWGTFLLDRALLVGGLGDLLDWGDLQGYQILVPRAAKLDDILVAVLGSSTLFLLRPRPHGEYKFLGPVIRRNGDLPDWSRVKTQTFVLV